MAVRAEPLEPVRRDRPARLANPEREIRFIPLAQAEGRIERPDALDRRPPDDPRTNHRVDFLEADPVERP